MNPRHLSGPGHLYTGFGGGKSITLAGVFRLIMAGEGLLTHEQEIKHLL